VSSMKFFLRLIIMLAIAIGGWFWLEGRLQEESFSRMPQFVQHLVGRVLTVENGIRHRVQMVESGATMIKEGKAMIEEGMRGSKN